MAAARAHIEVAVGGAAFDASGRVLLVERGRPPNEGRWTLPGGRVHFGEPMREACAREIHEETGLRVDVGPVVETLERIGEAGADGPSYHFVIVDFLVYPVGGELAAASDARAARFVDVDSISDLPHTEGLVPVIERARGLR